MGIKLRNEKFIKDASLPDSPLLPRHPHRPAGLYLLELRSHTARKKIEVTIDPKTGEDGVPQRVKIKHALKHALQRA